jgi:hypothetical protein
MKTKYTKPNHKIGDVVVLGQLDGIEDGEYNQVIIFKAFLVDNDNGTTSWIYNAKYITDDYTPKGKELEFVESFTDKEIFDNLSK